MELPQAVADALGVVAYEFELMLPFIPMYIHLILAALFPIYIGSYASLTRPTSAAKPDKRKGSSGGDDSDDDEEEDLEQRMAGFSKMDALLYPFIAGAVLTSLYFIIKLLQDPALLNLVLRWWFYSLSVFSVTSLVSDMLRVAHSFVFPKLYASQGMIFNVDQDAREARGGSPVVVRKSPLPGLLSKLPLPGAVLRLLWAARRLPSKKLTVKLYIRSLVAIRYHVDIFRATGLTVAIAAMAYETLVAKVWWLHNLFGFAFCYQSLMLLSPTTFTIGTILLSGLFIYDIVMVFYTPMMVGVAKSLDVPIMLMFPRPPEADDEPGVPRFGMLGLGDIVLPGIFMGLALRFDLYLCYLAKQRVITQSGHFDEHIADTQKEVTIKARYIPPSKYRAANFWVGSSRLHADDNLGAFRKTYFHASIFGYVIGMVATLMGMHFSKHPQPALLYLVPTVVGSVWLTALWRGELKKLLDYNEDVAEEDEKNAKRVENGAKQEKKGGLFQIFKGEEEAVERQLKTYGFEEGDSGTEADAEEPTSANGSTGALDKKTQIRKSGSKFARDKGRDLLFFSISTHAPLKRGDGAKQEKKIVADEPKWTSSTKEADGDELPKKRLRIA